MRKRYGNDYPTFGTLRQATTCPLRYIVGPTYESGMVSVYSGQNPALLEMGMPERSPWVDLADLQRSGAVYLYSRASDAPPEHPSMRKLEFKLLGNDKSLYDVYWTVVAPQACR